MTKLIVAFRSFSKVSENCSIDLATCAAKENITRKAEFVPSSDKLFQSSTQD